MLKRGKFKTEYYQDKGVVGVELWRGDWEEVLFPFEFGVTSDGEIDYIDVNMFRNDLTTDERAMIQEGAEHIAKGMWADWRFDKYIRFTEEPALHGDYLRDQQKDS